MPPYPKGAVRINGDVRVSDLYMTAAVTPAFAVSSRMDVALLTDIFPAMIRKVRLFANVFKETVRIISVEMMKSS